jgi:beta-lactamase superfamily II metal-dependent hydrolase
MKFLSALLAIIMLLSVLTACAKPTLDITQTDTNGSDISESNISTEATSDPETSETQESVKESETVDNSEPSKETDKDEEKPLTKFEKQFSVENEKRLAEILSSSVQEAELIEGSNIPTVSTAYSKKEASGDGGYTYIYNNASASLYDAWCEKLVASDYAQYTETEFNGVKYNGSNTLKNMFTTFVSTLAQVDIEYHEAAKRIYVTFTPRKASVLPQREAPTTATKQTTFPISWTYYGLEDIDDSEGSMGYIVKISDGSFIIIDGGEWFSEDSKSNAVAKRIYDILKKQSPDPNNIVISAWIITHAHNDHAGAFWTFEREYGELSSINLKQVIYNFPERAKTNGADGNYQCSIVEASLNFASKPEILKVHTGNVLYYPGISINVLYTQENYLAVSSDFKGNYNAASLVLQFVTNEGDKIFVGADHPVSGSYEGTPWCEGAIYNWYGSFIESDVATAFHHGYYGGADSTVYYVIKPKMVLLPCEQSRIEGSNLAKMPHNKYFMDMNNRPSGVSYWTSRNTVVGIITFSNGAPQLKYYDTIGEYLNS